MKKLLIILFSLSLGVGASAQYHGRIAGGAKIVRPQIVIGGYVPFTPYLGYGYGYGYGYGLNPFSPFSPYSNYRTARPSKLDMQVEDIQHDYKDRISSVKHDKSLPRRERKEKVKELKHERNEAVSDAKRNYYKTKPDYRS